MAVVLSRTSIKARFSEEEVPRRRLLLAHQDWVAQRFWVFPPVFFEHCFNLYEVKGWGWSGNQSLKCKAGPGPGRPKGLQGHA